MDDLRSADNAAESVVTTVRVWTVGLAAAGIDGLLTTDVRISYKRRRTVTDFLMSLHGADGIGSAGRGRRTYVQAFTVDACAVEWAAAVASASDHADQTLANFTAPAVVVPPAQRLTNSRAGVATLVGETSAI